MKKCIISVDSLGVCTVTFPNGNILVTDSKTTAESMCKNWIKKYLKQADWKFIHDHIEWKTND